MPLITRAENGAPLTSAQMDGNLLYLQALSTLDLIPASDDTYVIGNPSFRWHQLVLGSGNMILNDTGNSNSIPIGVYNGQLTLGNVTNFNVGNTNYGSFGISSNTPGDNIIMGTSGDSGFLEIANAGIQIDDSVGGSPSPLIKLININGSLDITGANKIAIGGMQYGTSGITFPDSSTLTTAEGFTSGSSGSSGINGTSGSSGINGTSGSSGSSGINGTSGSSGVSPTINTGVITPGGYPYTLTIDLSAAQHQYFRINATAGSGTYTVNIVFTNYTAGSQAEVYVFGGSTNTINTYPNCLNIWYWSESGVEYFSGGDSSAYFQNNNVYPIFLKYSCVDNTATNMMCTASPTQYFNA